MGVTAFALVLTELAMGVAESSSNSLFSSLAILAARAIGQIGVPLAHSRKLEQEADFVGINLAARAGYDPVCMHST